MGFFGNVLNHFQLILLTVVVAFGIVGLIDIVFFKKKRETSIKAAKGFNELSDKEQEKRLKAPFFADLAKELFWVLFVVFLLRSFVAEPFRIPSGSLLPTLQIGDWIIVTQYDYSVKTPVWDNVLFKTGKIHRGDIAVLHFPVDPNVDFIKRVIGLPGDKISYVNKVLYINGKKMPQTYVKSVIEPADSLTHKVKEYQEDFEGIKHHIYRMPWMPAHNFYNVVVPKGEYFVMGDNRDNSEDSRYWGFVPFKYFMGKARFVFWSWNDHYHPRWHRLFKAIH